MSHAPSRKSLDPAEAWLQENDPSYLASRQGWKHVRGKHCATPYEEILVGSPTDENEEMQDNGELDNAALFSDRYDPDRMISFPREADRLRDQQPHRKRDRHKGKRERDRAKYMREYRARKKAEGA